MSRFLPATVACTLLLLAVGVPGCDDDDSPTDTGPPITIYGSYTVLSVTSAKGDGALRAEIGPDAKILHFRSDHTYHILQATPQGFRSMQQGNFIATATQVDLEDRIYSYRVQGDELVLTRVAEEIRARRDDAATQPTAWVRPLETLATGGSPIDAATDLAWDGTALWCGNAYSSSHIYRINPATLALVDSLPAATFAWGIAWDGTTLWTSDDGSSRIYKLNMATGNTVHMSPEMGAWIKGIAWDGTNLWCVSGNETTLYQYNVASDTVVQQIALTGANSGLGGMEIVGGFLYMCYGGLVHKCTISPFGVSESYEMADRYIEGIAHDGSSFFLMGYDSHDWTPGIYRVR